LPALAKIGIPMKKTIDDFLSSQGYAPSTLATYTRILTAFDVDHPQPGKLSPRNLLDWVSRPNWGSSHRYVALTAVKTFLRWRYGANHPALVAKVDRRPSGRKKRSLNRDQITRLLASFNRYSLKGARDLALAALAIDTGLRLAELCNLRDADTDTQECACYVTIKGGKPGRGVFSPQTGAHIEHYRAMRGRVTDPLFVSTRTGEKLTREGLQTIVKKWGKILGVKLSPHDFRRTYCRRVLESGASTRQAQLGGRWSNIGMVELYSQDLEQDTIRPFLPLANL
jgi:integrase